MSSYKGKRFAVLGDSISTLDGYSKPDEAVFYQGMKKFESDVFATEDTWWGQVIDALGGVLWANDSFSGSTVSRKRGCTYPSFSCSDERTAALGKAGEAPDVIMIFMGINDWGNGIRVVPQTADENDDLSIFSVAYRVMLEKLRRNYPDAEIWCLTLPVSEWRAHADFTFPYCIGGRHINEYCEAIRACATQGGCRLIELHRPTQPHDTIDGFHPNAEGMKALSRAVLDCLSNIGI